MLNELERQPGDRPHKDKRRNDANLTPLQEAYKIVGSKKTDSRKENRKRLEGRSWIQKEEEILKAYCNTDLVTGE